MGISRGVLLFVLIFNDISNYHKPNRAISQDLTITEFLKNFKLKVRNILWEQKLPVDVIFLLHPQLSKIDTDRR